MKKQICTTLALLILTSPIVTAQAAVLEGDSQANVLIGPDDDNTTNPTVQPAEVAANQSLDNADIINGNGGNDVLIGQRGSDVIHGGPGKDILIGGLEGGTPAPKSDVIFGDSGNDVSIWAGGDGSDAFIGGPGNKDALVFGTIDRDASSIPTLTAPVTGFPHGIPTANVSGQNGFCTLEQVPEDSSLGYAFLVRFFTKSAGNALLVTVRVASDVEQVFCTSQESATITFADLTASDPQFVETSEEEVRELNNLVEQIIR